jgi:hypothetical protein
LLPQSLFMRIEKFSEIIGKITFLRLLSIKKALNSRYCGSKRWFSN